MLHKDYHAARVATPRKVRKVYKTANGTQTTFGNEKPYNELLEALAEASATFAKNRDTRLLMHKLAWFLGEHGEVDACEVIMSQAQEPRVYMYGVYG